MKNLSHQQGWSTYTLVLAILVAVFFGTCAVKLSPVYLQSYTVKRAVESTVKAAQQKEMTITEIKVMLGKQFDVNRVEGVSRSDIVIKRTKDGKIFLDVSYEKRVPLMFNIDVVLKFDEFKYEI